ILYHWHHSNLLWIILVAHIKIQDDQGSSLILFVTKLPVFLFMMKTYTGLNVFSFVLYHLQTSDPTHLSIQIDGSNFSVHTMPWMEFELSMVWSARYLAGYHQLNMSRAIKALKPLRSKNRTIPKVLVWILINNYVLLGFVKYIFVNVQISRDGMR
ncbi:hypothetical protein MKW92_032016, partial [Papaver armeniacum]